MFPKSEFHSLLDIMARIPALIELTERLSSESNLIGPTLESVDCLQSNWDLYSLLQNWYTELSAKSTESLYFEQPSASFFTHLPRKQLSDIFTSSLHFPTFEMARMHLFYWAALLRIYHNVSILQFLPSVSSRTQQPLVHDGPQDIAKLIAQSMQYLLSQKRHTLGPQNVFFPLRMAMHTFSKDDTNGREVRWCKAVFEELDSRGFPFGKILSECDWDDIPTLLSRATS